jgi:hypothetical protein
MLWRGIHNFIVLDMNNLTPRKEENLQYNYVALSVICDSINQKVFEQVKVS